MHFHHLKFQHSCDLDTAFFLLYYYLCTHKKQNINEVNWWLIWRRHLIAILPSLSVAPLTRIVVFSCLYEYMLCFCFSAESSCNHFIMFYTQLNIGAKDAYNSAPRCAHADNGEDGYDTALLATGNPLGLPCFREDKIWKDINST